MDGWPADTVVFTYQTPMGLGFVVQDLVARGHTFVVNPRTSSIAMSRAAAQEIGAY